MFRGNESVESNELIWLILRTNEKLRSNKCSKIKFINVAPAYQVPANIFYNMLLEIYLNVFNILKKAV